MTDPNPRPCPDPECGGDVTFLAGGAMGAHCETCERRWSTRSYAQRLARVQAELEEARDRVSVLESQPEKEGNLRGDLAGSEEARQALEKECEDWCEIVTGLQELTDFADDDVDVEDVPSLIRSRIAELERQLASSQEELAEARERAGLWRGYAALHSEQSERLIPWALNHGWRGDRDLFERGREMRAKLGIEEGAPISALRTELASQDEENGDE